MPSPCEMPTARLAGRAALLDGMLLEPLKVIATPGGPVMHMLRADSPHFAGFGELYFSEVLPGHVKAWKRHSRQTQFFTVPVGQMRFVLHDDRAGSSTRGQLCEVLLGRPDNYALLRIPVGVWYGFTCVGDTPALIANCADMPHDPAEGERLPEDDPAIPYRW